MTLRHQPKPGVLFKGRGTKTVSITLENAHWRRLPRALLPGGSSNTTDACAEGSSAVPQDAYAATRKAYAAR